MVSSITHLVLAKHYISGVFWIVYAMQFVFLCIFHVHASLNVKLLHVLCQILKGLCLVIWRISGAINVFVTNYCVCLVHITLGYFSSHDYFNYLWLMTPGLVSPYIWWHIDLICVHVLCIQIQSLCVRCWMTTSWARDSVSSVDSWHTHGHDTSRF